ncbi:hypothetical protein, partial [Mesorhizobium kowhaii]|uniref:hypothetical protein n=1 Tax=Mesorhizobium kowhaii TaxID=1300272 RepID=UPI001ABFF50F
MSSVNASGVDETAQPRGKTAIPPSPSKEAQAAIERTFVVLHHGSPSLSEVISAQQAPAKQYHREEERQHRVHAKRT